MSDTHWMLQVGCCLRMNARSARQVPALIGRTASQGLQAAEGGLPLGEGRAEIQGD